MSRESTNYQAYLLRLWRTNVNATGAPIWRASLEDPHTGERLGFATLEQLFAYLMERTEEVAHLSPTAAAGAANPPAPSGPNTTIKAGQPDADGASSLLNDRRRGGAGADHLRAGAAHS